MVDYPEREKTELTLEQREFSDKIVHYFELQRARLEVALIRESNEYRVENDEQIPDDLLRNLAGFHKRTMTEPSTHMTLGFSQAMNEVPLEEMFNTYKRIRHADSAREYLDGVGFSDFITGTPVRGYLRLAIQS